MARKPFSGTLLDNYVKWGTGALNIEACRIAFTGPKDAAAAVKAYMAGIEAGLGRWPPNAMFDEEAAALLDAQTGELASGFMAAGTEREGIGYHGGLGNTVRHDTHGDRGGASRFYYVAKPSREERDYGCDILPPKTAAELTGRKPGSAGLQNPRAGIRAGSMDRDIAARVARNFHPTVKPVELMRWLVRLVTPIDGVVLDPFCGSGTTGMACRYEQRRFIGLDREPTYLDIARCRVAAVAPLFASHSERQPSVGLIT